MGFLVGFLVGFVVGVLDGGGRSKRVPRKVGEGVVIAGQQSWNSSQSQIELLQSSLQLHTPRLNRSHFSGVNNVVGGDVGGTGVGRGVGIGVGQQVS